MPAAPATPEISNVGDALESLVHQFADPWAFLRELVQNAIDAGTEQLEVRIDHDEARGTMIIEVADSGEGMTREIIDTRLTRLFSSSKEGDYTKIGRFGIGFVSVFALDPEIVCVDTGRAGEWWRVVFRRDRSFERIRLNNPVEGTTVRLYKPASADEVEQARIKARETLEHWCKHAKIELRCDGEPISRPLDLEGLCKVEHREEGTTLVMALVGEPLALRGYYHGGLTLHEEHDDALPHVAFKIDSRFLEHTLTRDNVIRDDNYAKAMAIVGKVARTRLVAAMFEALEQRARAGEGSSPDRDLLYRTVTAQFGKGEPDPSWSTRAVIPMLGGPACSLVELRERPRASKLFRALEPSPVVERLRGEGHRVIACGEKDCVDDLLGAALRERPLPVASLCTAVPLAAPEDPSDWAPLLAALAALLANKWKVSELAVGHLAYPGSPVADHVAISQARVGELTAIADVGQLASGWLASGRALVLNADHPILIDLHRVAAREPELAAYLTLKSFFLQGELSPALDAEISNLAVEARWRRMAS
ncbi:sacsin N-terminal ATP-binding-like domain-containing protein [Nannocystaceae bacterium ST9]